MRIHREFRQAHRNLRVEQMVEEHLRGIPVLRAHADTDAVDESARASRGDHIINWHSLLFQNERAAAEEIAHPSFLVGSQSLHFGGATPIFQHQRPLFS